MDMTIGLALAGLFGIPCVAIALGAIGKQWLALKERHAVLAAGAEAAELARQAETIRALEQRVSTLERIATDPGLRLADEIERLHLAPPAARLAAPAAH